MQKSQVITLNFIILVLEHLLPPRPGRAAYGPAECKWTNDTEIIISTKWLLY